MSASRVAVVTDLFVSLLLAQACPVLRLGLEMQLEAAHPVADLQGQLVPKCLGLIEEAPPVALPEHLCRASLQVHALPVPSEDLSVLLARVVGVACRSHRSTTFQNAPLLAHFHGYLCPSPSPIPSHFAGHFDCLRHTEDLAHSQLLASL